MCYINHLRNYRCDGDFAPQTPLLDPGLPQVFRQIEAHVKLEWLIGDFHGHRQKTPPNNRVPLLMNSLELIPCDPLDGSIRPPGSKSITNRALACAALAAGESVLTGVLDSEDTRVMVAALERLGIAVTANWQNHRLRVAGCGGRIPASEADLYVSNSGTSIRFLAALVSLGRGSFRLDGNARMRQRPIGDLLETLEQLGATIQTELEPGCPPVRITAHGMAGGHAQVRGNMSSQFLSGLLLAAPAARDPLELDIDGVLVSVPYVEMTLAVMQAFGAKIDVTRHGPAASQAADSDDKEAGPPRRFQVANQGYVSRGYVIEPDASAASYFWAAAAIRGGRVTVEGLSRESLQGDVAFADCLARMGCEVQWMPDAITVVRSPDFQGAPLRGITVDMNAISDTVMTLAVVALFAEGPTTITGVGHIRYKETDRIAALATELTKLGAQIEPTDDGLRITPGEFRPAVLDTYDDHRMAMSLSLPGLRQPGVVINDPGCTRKTYPNFFDDLTRLTGASYRMG